VRSYVLQGVLALVGGLLTAASPAQLASQTCRATWTLEETLRIGSIEGEVTLTEVFDLELGLGGEIFLAQMFTPEVQVLSAEGRPIRTIGRAGGGPGEFLVTVNRLGFNGDQLWAAYLSGMELFDRDQRPMRSIRFRTVISEQSSAFTPGVLLADGTVLGNRQITLTRESRGGGFFNAGSAPLLRFSPSGAVLDTIVLVERAPGWFVDDLLVEHPLHDWHDISWLPVTAFPDGGSVVLIGNVRSGGDRNSFDLLRIGIDGDTLLRRTIPYDARPVTRGQRDRLTEEFAARHAGEFTPSQGQGAPGPPDQRAMERRRQEAREAISFPEHHPPVRQIVAGHDGTIWLLRELNEDRVDRWEIFDKEGDRIGSLRVEEGRSSQIPWRPRIRLLRATREEVWGTSLGEYDVPYVHRYRVVDTCE